MILRHYFVKKYIKNCKNYLSKCKVGLGPRITFKRVDLAVGQPFFEDR